MRLVSTVVGFFLRKLGLLAALVLSLFLGYLVMQSLVPALREAAADRDRLERVVEERAALQEDLGRLQAAAAAARSEATASLEAELGDEVGTLQGAVADKRAEVERLRDGQQDVCGLVRDLIDLVTPGDACDAAEAAVREADEALDSLEGGLARAEEGVAVLRDPDLSDQEKLDRLGRGDDPAFRQDEIDAQESALAETRSEEDTLEEAQGSGTGWVVDQWARSWKWLAVIALTVLLAPIVLRVVSYFVLMPVVRRLHTPVRLADEAEAADAEIRTSDAQRTMTVHVGAGEVLSTRSAHVRSVQGRARSRLLYDWSSPFISYAAGLHEMSRLVGDEAGGSVTLANPDDPNAYLMRIDLRDHPGLVMHPKHVVGVVGTPTLETRWRWGVHAFATWQVRYILFAGTGGLIVEGCGDVVATNPEGRATRVNQNLVMGFDSRLSLGVNRTEVFWPYLRGRAPLVDDEFTGHHPLFGQQSDTGEAANPVTRTFNALFSGLGKLFGF